MSVIRLHSHSTNTWLRINQPRPQARLRLFCFPYAGGAASLYRTWPQHLPPTIELCAVQLPGRENRIRESPYTNLVDLVAALLPNLLPVLDKPFALFGHSMGALIAYEVARQLQQHRQIPTHLLVSGRRAPVLPEPEALPHTLPSDEAFLRELHRRYHNIPTVLFEETELRALFVPLLRADLTLVETYQCIACHRIGAANGVAPAYEGIAARAAARRPPMPAASYIYESITNPSAYIVEGYVNSMIQDFAQRLSDQELGDIIAYLLTPEAH